MSFDEMNDRENIFKAEITCFLKSKFPFLNPIEEFLMKTTTTREIFDFLEKEGLLEKIYGGRKLVDFQKDFEHISRFHCRFSTSEETHNSSLAIQRWLTFQSIEQEVDMECFDYTNFSRIFEKFTFKRFKISNEVLVVDHTICYRKYELSQREGEMKLVEIVENNDQSTRNLSNFRKNQGSYGTSKFEFFYQETEKSEKICCLPLHPTFKFRYQLIGNDYAVSINPYFTNFTYLLIFHKGIIVGNTNSDIEISGTGFLRFIESDRKYRCVYEGQECSVGRNISQIWKDGQVFFINDFCFSNLNQKAYFWKMYNIYNGGSKNRRRKSFGNLVEAFDKRYILEQKGGEERVNKYDIHSWGGIAETFLITNNLDGLIDFSRCLDNMHQDVLFFDTILYPESSFSSFSECYQKFIITLHFCFCQDNEFYIPTEVLSHIIIPYISEIDVLLATYKHVETTMTINDFNMTGLKPRLKKLHCTNFMNFSDPYKMWKSIHSIRNHLFKDVEEKSSLWSDDSNDQSETSKETVDVNFFKLERKGLVRCLVEMFTEFFVNNETNNFVNKEIRLELFRLFWMCSVGCKREGFEILYLRKEFQIPPSLFESFKEIFEQIIKKSTRKDYFGDIFSTSLFRKKEYKLNSNIFSVIINYAARDTEKVEDVSSRIDLLNNFFLTEPRDRKIYQFLIIRNILYCYEKFFDSLSNEDELLDNETTSRFESSMFSLIMIFRISLPYNIEIIQSIITKLVEKTKTDPKGSLFLSIMLKYPSNILFFHSSKFPANKIRIYGKKYRKMDYLELGDTAFLYIKSLLEILPSKFLSDKLFSIIFREFSLFPDSHTKNLSVVLEVLMISSKCSKNFNRNLIGKDEKEIKDVVDEARISKRNLMIRCLYAVCDYCSDPPGVTEDYALDPSLFQRIKPNSLSIILQICFILLDQEMKGGEYRFVKKVRIREFILLHNLKTLIEHALTIDLFESFSDIMVRCDCVLWSSRVIDTLNLIFTQENTMFGPENPNYKLSKGQLYTFRGREEHVKILHGRNPFGDIQSSEYLKKRKEVMDVFDSGIEKISRLIDKTEKAVEIWLKVVSRVESKRIDYTAIIWNVWREKEEEKEEEKKEEKEEEEEEEEEEEVSRNENWLCKKNDDSLKYSFLPELFKVMLLFQNLVEKTTEEEIEGENQERIVFHEKLNFRFTKQLFLVVLSKGSMCYYDVGMSEKNRNLKFNQKREILDFITTNSSFLKVNPDDEEEIISQIMKVFPKRDERGIGRRERFLDVFEKVLLFPNFHRKCLLIRFLEYIENLVTLSRREEYFPEIVKKMFIGMTDSMREDCIPTFFQKMFIWAGNYKNASFAIDIVCMLIKDLFYVKLPVDIATKNMVIILEKILYIKEGTKKEKSTVLSAMKDLFEMECEKYTGEGSLSSPVLEFINWNLVSTVMKVFDFSINYHESSSAVPYYIYDHYLCFLDLLLCFFKMRPEIVSFGIERITTKPQKKNLESLFKELLEFYQEVKLLEDHTKEEELRKKKFLLTVKKKTVDLVCFIFEKIYEFGAIEKLFSEHKFFVKFLKSFSSLVVGNNLFFKKIREFGIESILLKEEEKVEEDNSFIFNFDVGNVFEFPDIIQEQSFEEETKSKSKNNDEESDIFFF